jgi:TPR repeat protein
MGQAIKQLGRGTGHLLLSLCMLSALSGEAWGSENPYDRAVAEEEAGRYEAALPLYQESCDEGFIPGCVGAAVLYENGLGTERDHAHARMLYSEACDAGLELGCEAIYRLIMTGDEDLSESTTSLLGQLLNEEQSDLDQDYLVGSVGCDPAVEPCETGLEETSDEESGGVQQTGMPNMNNEQRARVLRGAGTVSSGLSSEAVERTLQHQMNRFRYCYERSLRGSPLLSGEMGWRWQIGENGSVVSVELVSDGMEDSSLSSCLTRVLGNIRFPADNVEDVVTVEYRFNFIPANPPGFMGR